MAAIQGNWQVSVGLPKFVYADQPNGDRLPVARVWAGADRDYQGTARLVAAAPELLAALKDAYDALDYAQAQVDSEDDRMRLTRCRRKIKPVIYKAEGRSE